MGIKHGELTLDLGNSETRASVKLEVNGKTAEVEYTNISNRFYSYMEKESITLNKTYKPENTSIFSIDGDYAGVYANGLIVEREFASKALPISMDTKASQNSALSFSLVIIKAIEFAIKEFGLDIEDEDTFNWAWSVTVILPPAQCTEKVKSEFESKLRGVKTIKNLFAVNAGRATKYTIPVVVEDITIYPEGFVGFVGACYTRDVDIRSGYEKYTDDCSVLIIDIGSGTSDILIVVDGEIVSDSQNTITIGGSDVKVKLKKALKAEFGFTKITDTDLEAAIRTGKIKDGAIKHDCSKLVTMAKREVSQALINEIQDCLKDIDIPLRSIEQLLVIGGGTLGGEEGSGIEPTSTYILEYLKTYASNIGAIELPTLEDGSKLSPRLANFEGACILAKAV